MTRDEIRGLMGGYATGSLTEGERQILFAAALEDQDLFDELAREQALKEALEEPGARARLIAALAPPTLIPQAWWKTTWAWGALAAASVALIAGIVLLHSSARVEQVARLEVPQLPGPPAPEPVPAPPPVPPSVALPAPKAAAPAPAAKPTPAAASEVKPAAPEVKQGEKQEVQREAKQEAPAAAAPAAPAAADAFGVNGGVVAGVAPPGIPPAPPFAPQAFAQGNTALGTGTLAAPIQPAPAPAQAGGRGGRGGGGGGRGGGRGGAGGARALAQPQAAQAGIAPRFSFDYTVTQQFVLRISPSANGFLTVNVTKASSSAPLIAARPIQAGAVTEVQLPDDSVSVMVVFSAQEKVGGFAGDIPGGSDPLSGTKSDPNPSPNSVLVAVIQLRR